MLSEIRDTIASVEKTVRNVVRRLERETSAVLYSFKRGVFTSAIELTLVLFSILCIAIGVIFFLTRFVSLDIVLVVVGLIILNVVFFSAKFRP